jgi:DNA-binding GntR family transcriptional regulator
MPDGRIPTPVSELDYTMPARVALPDRVYAVLKHRILTCALEPEKKLNEKHLAEELGVSRTPLREALNRLALEGLVNLVQFKGYAVSSITTDDICHLSELRRIVESEAAAIAAVRATSADYEHLLSLAELHYTPGNRKTYENYLQENTSFHFALVRSTHNPRLEAVVISVLDQLQRPLYLGLDVGIDAKSATDEHLAVVAAVRAHDAAQARDLTASQISHTERRMLAALTGAAKAG